MHTLDGCASTESWTLVRRPQKSRHLPCRTWTAKVITDSVSTDVTSGRRACAAARGNDVAGGATRRGRMQRHLAGRSARPQSRPARRGMVAAQSAPRTSPSKFPALAGGPTKV